MPLHLVEDLNLLVRILAYFNIEKAFTYYLLVKQLHMAGCCK